MNTSRDVIQTLFSNRPPERVGVMDNIWGDTLRKWVTQGYPTHKVAKTVKEKAVEDGREVTKEVEKEVDEPVDLAEHFGFDMVGAGGWFDMLPLKGFREVEQETDEWYVVRNGAGAALKYWKNKSGTPEHIDFRMTSREIWERDYRRYLLEPDPTRVGVEGAKKGLARRREQGYWTHYGHLFIFENMRRSLGDLCMYESLVLDPAWIHDYNRVHTDFYKAHYKMLFDGAGLPDGIWMYEDLGYKERLFVSPKTLREMIFPYFAEVVEFFHGYGLPVTLHTCGSTREALPLIVEAGFDGLHPMERAAGNDPFEYAERYADKLVFIGGFDKRILETHDRALIRKEVGALINGMKDRGARYVFASDHSISTNTDYDDFRFMLDVYREHMTY